VPSDAAEDLLAGYDPEQAAFLRGAVAALPTDPETILTSTEILDLLLAGYLDEPALDPEALQQVRDGLPIVDVNLDDEFELREVDEGILAELVPSWVDG
jgi:hypothetical protein